MAMTKSQMIDFINVKLNHNATRKADIPQLMHIASILDDDQYVLSHSQRVFVEDLHKEYVERNKRYNKKQRNKKLRKRK